MDTPDLATSVTAAAALLRALANDRRLLILCELSTGEKTVGALEAAVGLRQSALSQHLARLRRDGLVGTRREAQHIFYHVTSTQAVRLIETLAGLYCTPEAPSTSSRPNP